ncbi:hypothetical protein EPR50_G00197640 [Perca flavescens]|uniref:Uncharacterized protein n=1 Tax=Perca flavescens TaxID=8167 RepID=A0A484C6Y0_PERFV|nr:hypothetical protein EPR50_G00197640 [Perca flavescens]
MSAAAFITTPAPAAIAETRRTDLTLALGAAYRRQQQPHGPQDILDPSLHHTSSPPSPKSFQLFFFYTVTYSKFTGSALATPPLTPQ